MSIKIILRRRTFNTKKSKLTLLPNGKDIVDVVAVQPGLKSDINLFAETINNFDYRQKFHDDKTYDGEEAVKKYNITL